jgi:hypothetical protein
MTEHYSDLIPTIDVPRMPIEMKALQEVLEFLFKKSIGDSEPLT